MKTLFRPAFTRDRNNLCGSEHGYRLFVIGTTVPLMFLSVRLKRKHWRVTPVDSIEDES